MICRLNGKPAAERPVGRAQAGAWARFTGKLNPAHCVQRVRPEPGGTSQPAANGSTATVGERTASTPASMASNAAPSSARRLCAAIRSVALSRVPSAAMASSPGSIPARSASAIRCRRAAAPANQSVWNSASQSPAGKRTGCSSAPAASSCRQVAAKSAATSGATVPQGGSSHTPSRSPRNGTGPASTRGYGTGDWCQSRRSRADSTSSMAAASATPRVIGPRWATVPKALAG